MEESGLLDEEEVTYIAVVELNNLIIETVVTKDEAAEGLEPALQMNIEEEG